MDESYAIFSILNTIVSAVLVLSYLAVAGISIFRFKTTASGLILAGSYALLALLIFGSALLHFIFSSSETGLLVSSVVLTLSDFVLTLGIALGIGLIPRSLRALRGN